MQHSSEISSILAAAPSEADSPTPMHVEVTLDPWLSTMDEDMRVDRAPHGDNDDHDQEIKTLSVEGAPAVAGNVAQQANVPESLRRKLEHLHQILSRQEISGTGGREGEGKGAESLATEQLASTSQASPTSKTSGV